MVDPNKNPDYGDEISEEYDDEKRDKLLAELNPPLDKLKDEFAGRAYGQASPEGTEPGNSHLDLDALRKILESNAVSEDFKKILRQSNTDLPIGEDENHFPDQ